MRFYCYYMVNNNQLLLKGILLIYISNVLLVKKCSFPSETCHMEKNYFGFSVRIFEKIEKKIILKKRLKIEKSKKYIIRRCEQEAK